MKHIGTIFGSMIAGLLVIGIMGGMANQYGLIGGWFGALAAISLAWGVNHYVGIINNADRSVAIDMGLGIAVAGIARGVFVGDSLGASIPTLVFLGIGGALGGVAAAAILRARKAGAK